MRERDFVAGRTWLFGGYPSRLQHAINHKIYVHATFNSQCFHIFVQASYADCYKLLQNDFNAREYAVLLVFSLKFS